MIGLTQVEFARRAGLSLSFVRNLEQGKKTVRLDKVNQALKMFSAEVVPQRTIVVPVDFPPEGYYV